MTIFAAYRTTVARLAKPDAEAPSLEYSGPEAHATTRILLDAVSGVTHAHLIDPDMILSPQQIERLQRCVLELENGRPLAYVLGTREFYGLQFRCDERALIPRPETELLVEAALDALRRAATAKATTAKAATAKVATAKEPPRVADLGTGTGCIAILLAHSFPTARVYATDVSPDALALARINANALGVAERVNFIPGMSGDWAAPLHEYSGRLDVIVSNPPYIAPRHIDQLQIQIRNFEPRRALDGGPDGLDCYRQIAAQCGALLLPTGVLFCELGENQFEAVRAIFESFNWKVGKTIFDLQGIARVLSAQRMDATRSDAARHKQRAPQLASELAAQLAAP